ncbi:MAG TPA: sulfate permease, partial [Candidatus Limnocylindrales bacterium]|nr:sulfate permease [Candidatus Limnocylindrales bacterium]
MGHATRARTGNGVAAGLAQLRGYTPSLFRADLLAGITVTAYLVPQCLAYADLAGAPPASGLWVAVVAMIVYALLGTSRQLSVGPESATAIMVAAAVAPLAAADPSRYAVLSAGLAVMVGLLCIAAFAVRLGFVADLLSYPVLIGYMAGVALIMIGSQLGTIAGIRLEADGAIGKVVELFGRLDEIQPVTLVIGLSVTVFLLVLRRLAPLAPGTLIAIVGAGAVVAVFGLEAQGVSIVGPVPSQLPTPVLPALTVADITALLGSAAAIAFVGYTDVALTARAFAARTGETIDANREFLALGAANVAAGLTGGFALSASGSRTAIIDAMRAHSQVTGLVAAAAVIIVVLLVPGLIALIPRAALAGIVIYAALRLIDLPGLRRLADFRTTEFGLAIAALVGVLVFDVLAGILVAVGLSVAELFARVARPPAAVLGRVPGLAGLHNVEDYPDAQTIPGLVVFRYDAPLCFANAQDFRAHSLDAVDAQEEPVRWFLLNAEAIVELDVTSADALRDLVTDLADRQIVFAMARVKQDLRAYLRRAGLFDVIDE